MAFVRIALLSVVLSFPPQPAATPVAVGPTVAATTILATTVPATSVPATSVATTPIPRPTGPSSGPAPGATTYTVRAGDTLASIAARLGITIDDLAAANGIQNPNLIAVGQVLKIPSTGPTPTPVPLPAGLELSPVSPQQGQTFEVRITTTGVTTATGTFLGQKLRFIPSDRGLFALVGVSRCEKPGTYPLNLNTDGPQPLVVNQPVNVLPTNFETIDITLTPDMAAALSDPVAERAENQKITTIVNQFTPVQYWSGKLSFPLTVTNPLDWTTASFGQRRSYNGGPVGACGHEGQDFGVPAGTPVFAPSAGRVVLAETQKVRGNVVFIDLGEGVYSGFYHLSKILVQPGQMVQAGDKVGLVGTTGFSNGPHLHWSLWVEGEYVNPIEWVERNLP